VDVHTPQKKQARGKKAQSSPSARVVDAPEEDDDEDADHPDSEDSPSTPSRPTSKVSRSPKPAQKKLAAGKSFSGAKLSDWLEVRSHFDDPIYDDCNEVRNKIRAYLRKGEMNQSRFLQHLHINSNSYYHFMGYEGPLTGGQNQTYRAAYWFFELQRIASGKPKSKRRLGVAAAFGEEGRPCFHSGAPRLRCYLGDVPVIGHLGRIVIVRPGTNERKVVTGRGTEA
jgi:hypothetical protein